MDGDVVVCGEGEVGGGGGGCWCYGYVACNKLGVVGGGDGTVEGNGTRYSATVVSVEGVGEGVVGGVAITCCCGNEGVC